MIEIVVLVVVLLAALAVGVLLRRREGSIRPTEPTPADETADSGGNGDNGGNARAELLAAVGVTPDRPAVLHFSAEWCGPCGAVRRVVAEATGQLADTAQPPADIEVDIDEAAALARELNVLSLPTTFVFDGAGRERFRISGVPKVTDLRTALEPMTTAPTPG